MITCEVLRRHVDAVVDGEVDPDTQIEFERHLAECGPCRVHTSFARSFKKQVKEACGPSEPPGDLAARVRAALDTEDARRAAAQPGAPVGTPEPKSAPLGIAGIRLHPVRARYAVPAAAAAVALAVIAAQSGDDSENGFQADIQSSSIFEDIVRRHSSEHPAEVSGPPTQVASWFQGKLEFPVRPVAFASPDVRLVGARISNVNNREAAAFYYTVGGHRVTVMVFEPSTPVGGYARAANVRGRRLYYGQAHGHTVPLVEHDGLTYAFTGDLDRRALLQLAASARLDAP